METKKTYFRRHLPHYQPEQATFFVTFRLANSLPREIVVRLKEEQAAEEILLHKRAGQLGKLSYNTKRSNLRKRYFAKFDEYLDKVNTGEKWLQDEKVAKIVADAIHFLDGKKYNLICYCIMPNHVHLVISISENVGQLSKLSIGATRQERQVGNLFYNLSPILFSLKRFTSGKANKLLNRRGAFWQHESYDHIVRDEKELYRIVEYILNNPVKAGLVSEQKEWMWSYVKKFE